MTHLPARLTPDPGERGLASHDSAAVGAAALEAWDALLELAAGCDLTRVARAHGWTGVEVLLTLGDWPENRSLDQILDDARVGREGTVDQADDVRRVHEAHRDATPDEAVTALRRSRDAIASWVADGGPAAEGLLPTRSLLGTLPVLTLVHATAFQVAVSARDLAACGAEHSARLDDIGLLALVDTTGALAARQRVTASLTVRTPDSFLGTGAHEGSWRTADLTRSTDGTSLSAADERHGPGVIATAGTFLDIASGRASVPSLYASGEVAVTDLAGLLALAPIIEGVPGIPAGAALARAARLMSGVGGLLGSLFRRG